MKIGMFNSVRCYTKQQPGFGAGKVDAYFDFDGTYCPVPHKDLHSASPVKQPWFSEYCSNFRKFFNNTRDDFSFNITTGRTLGEYDAVSRLIKTQGFELPLPDTLIAKNGSDRHIKVGTDAEFYQKGIFPFRPDKTSAQKEKDIETLTGWNGARIKSKLREIFKEHHLRVVEADSENGVGDYGPRSLFSEGKLPDERNKVFSGTDKSDWCVGLRNDGNCKIFVTYPPDMESCPERSGVLGAINGKIKAFFEELGLSGKYHNYSDKCRNRPCAIYEPLVDDRLRDFTDKVYNQGLTKLYDTKEAVKKAIENNDLVIVAGDGINDVTMLNPLMYINSKMDPRTLQEMLEQNPEEYTGIIKELENLPFIGIVVKNKGEDSPLNSIVDAFGENSRYKKIIEVENGHLEDGVRKAIKLYAEKNPEYAAKLSPGLRKEIFGEETPTSPKAACC